MSNLLPGTTLLATFVGASLVLAVTPGPGVFYIVARSVAQGRKCGLASVAGVAAGNWCNAVAASIGLAAVLAVSSAAFAVVKLTGAAYLIYLGVKTLRGTVSDEGVRLSSVPAMRLFRDGFIVALLNPKTAIFFAAFLPQFMTANASPTVQGVLLGSLFVGIAAITDSVYALAASTASSFLSRSAGARRAGRLLAGSVFIGLGIYAVFAGNRKLIA
jgi:threonine/homoserine/homoserine lactone efflux protein